MYEAELERAHGQMLEEMQSLEEDKNRAIEEAFARAQVEMKAVHENLAGEPEAGPAHPHPPCLTAQMPNTFAPLGVRTNLLTLQPALRTLTNDYNGLKRQVRGFPLLLQEALRSVKAEVSKPSVEARHFYSEPLIALLPKGTPKHTFTHCPLMSSHLCRSTLYLFI